MKKETDVVKDQIIDESVGLFLKHGIKRVTVDDIAKHFSISKKTFYKYFKDKEDLILLGTKRHLESESMRILNTTHEAENAVEHLHLISKCMRENFRHLNQNILFDLKKYYSQAWKLYLDFEKNVIYKQVLDTLVSGIEEGYFRKDIYPEILAKLRMLEIQMSFDTEIFPDNKYGVMEIQFQLFDHFIHGILTPTGLELFDQYKNQLTHEQ